MTTSIDREPWSKIAGHQVDDLVDREWLVTNGLGGYASGTLLGVCSRKYHGLLIASLPGPLGRTMMLNHLIEELQLGSGKVIPLAGDFHPTAESLEACRLASFSLRSGLPVWRYEADGCVLEKRVWMQYRANTVFVAYRLIEAPGSVQLRLRPGLHFRPHDWPAGNPLSKPYDVTARGDRFEIAGPEMPPLRLCIAEHSGVLVLDGGSFYGVEYELERGAVTPIATFSGRRAMFAPS